jgi:hypothetical protein
VRGRSRSWESIPSQESARNESNRESAWQRANEQSDGSVDTTTGVPSEERHPLNKDVEIALWLS